MRVGTPGFVPARLTEARAARRLGSMSFGTQPEHKREYGRALGEDGSSAPDVEAMTALTGLLQVRREFFLRSVFESPRALFYRSLSSTLVRDISYQEPQMRWLQSGTISSGCGPSCLVGKPERR
jgi:hypothetical protein